MVKGAHGCLVALIGSLVVGCGAADGESGEEPAGTTEPVGTTESAIANGVVRRLQNVQTNRCIRRVGLDVRLAPCTGDVAERVVFESTGEYRLLRFAGTPLCLQFDGLNFVNGNLVSPLDSVLTGASSCELIRLRGSPALIVPDGSPTKLHTLYTQDGAPLCLADRDLARPKLRPCGDGTRQKWRLLMP